MKRYILLTIILFSAVTLKAQYYASHPIINEANQMLMQMQMATMQQQNQWTPQTTVFAVPDFSQFGGWETAPATPIISYETVTEKCEHCDGQGFITHHHYSSDGGYTTKQRCSFCHGNGQIKKSVLKEDE